PLDLDEGQAVLGEARVAGGLGVRLLRLEVLERVVDLLVDDGLELALDREALVLAERDLRTEADLEGVAEVGALDGRQLLEVDRRAADDLELVLVDGLLEGLAEEVLDRAAADLLAVLAL